MKHLIQSRNPYAGVAILMMDTVNLKNFVFFSSLSGVLFRSFIAALISYCLPVLFTALDASDKKSLRKIFNDATKLGIDHPEIGRAHV